MHVEMVPVSPGFESLRCVEGQIVRGHNILYVFHSYIRTFKVSNCFKRYIFISSTRGVYVDMFLVSCMSNVFTILDAQGPFR